VSGFEQLNTPVIASKTERHHAAIQESGKVHYSLDCFASLAMTKGGKYPVLGN